MSVLKQPTGSRHRFPHRFLKKSERTNVHGYEGNVFHGLLNEK